MSLAIHIKAEPRPTGNNDPGRFSWDTRDGNTLPRPRALPDLTLSTILRDRTSLPAEAKPTAQQLGDILWHSNFVRMRNPATASKRGWESRNTPAAGGLYGIETLVLPLEAGEPCGWYDPIRHQLMPITDVEETALSNRENVAALCGATSGVTLQFICDARRLAVLYDNSETLMWRDAGCLIATLALVASAIGACATPLGRVGLPGHLLCPDSESSRWTPAGAVHLTRGK